MRTSNLINVIEKLMFMVAITCVTDKQETTQFCDKSMGKIFSYMFMWLKKYIN